MGAETEFIAQIAKQGDVPTAAIAENETFADSETAQLRNLAVKPVDKLVTGQSAQVRVELKNESFINTQLLKRAKSLRERLQMPRGQIGLKDG